MAERWSSRIRIRPATAGDREFVLGLVPELAAFGPPPWRSVDEMVETDTLVLGRALDGLAADATVLIAEDARGVGLGFIHLTADADYYTRRECGHVSDLVVAAAARGRGVGERLMAAAEEWAAARGYALLTLNVFVGNARARALYERTGFGAETVRYVKTVANPTASPRRGVEEARTAANRKEAAR
jgi:GNAT superfamily N-acetyltransferase